MKEVITIQVSNYFTNELAAQIAEMHWGASIPQCVSRFRQELFDDKKSTDGFGVFAENAGQEVVGRLHCARNEIDPKLWYYGDLFVVPEYRGMGIARRMIRCAVNHLSDMGANVLRCYVLPQNMQSMHLQLSMGFTEKPYEQFNLLSNEGQIMFEYELPNQLSILPASRNEAYFVRLMFAGNRKYLHCENISMQEWRELLSSDDPDEKHFLICKGAMPVGYMKINGLLNRETAWISMLFIMEKYHHRGIGTYAVRFAEGFIKDRGFSAIGIQTTDDNTPAKNLYTKCGYKGEFDPMRERWCFMKKLKD